jgi:2-phosphoglycerate kinase
MNKLTTSMRNIGVDDECAETIADKVKSKLVKSATPIDTEKIEDIVVDELEKKNSNNAKKFKKRYRK